MEIKDGVAYVGVGHLAGPAPKADPPRHPNWIEVEDGTYIRKSLVLAVRPCVDGRVVVALTNGETFFAKGSLHQVLRELG